MRNDLKYKYLKEIDKLEKYLNRLIEINFAKKEKDKYKEKENDLKTEEIEKNQIMEEIKNVVDNYLKKQNEFKINNCFGFRKN